MNTNGEDELRELLKAACKPAVASPEFKGRLLKRLTQEVSRQAIRPPRPSGQKPMVWAPSDAGDAGNPAKELISAELVSNSRV